MNKSNQWKNIWNNKSVQTCSTDIIGSLIKANGFDTGCGDYSVEQWRIMTAWIIRILDISTESKVLEVGCGSGALLYEINVQSNSKIFGYDYSSSLINFANLYVKGEFKVSEAILNPFEPIKFDVVISHSVFQYFPNKNYANETIAAMSRALNPGGRIAILDLNDESHKNNYYEERRRNYRNSEEYDKKYNGLTHEFYNKSEIKKTLTNLGFVEILFPDHPVPEYINSRLRFNVIAKKR